MGCVMLGGPTYTLDGVSFEWSDRFGPAVLDKRGEIANKQPGPRHRFWQKVSWWAQQGKRVTPTGQCIYDRPAEPRVVHIVGRHYAVVPEGADPEAIRHRYLRLAKPNADGAA